MLEDVKLIDIENTIIDCPLNKQKLNTDWCLGCTINDEIYYNTSTKKYICKAEI